MPEALLGAIQPPGAGVLLLAVLAAGLVRGFSGFGSAMIIMPAASSVLSPVGAVVFLSVVELVGPLPNVPDALRNSERRDLLRLGAGMVIGMPIGIWSLTRIAPEVFGWAVSLTVLCLLGLLLTGWRYKGRLSGPLVTGAGALGGVTSGAVGLAGPPVIMLYMASRLPIATIRANFLLYLLMVDVLMLLSLAVLGELEGRPIALGALLVIPYVVANIGGARLFRPQSEGLFRAVAYVIIAIAAVLGLPIWE